MVHFIATLLIAGALTPTPDQAKTIAELEDKLMAPCCYSQTIRVHMSMEAERIENLMARLAGAQGAGSRASKPFEGKGRLVWR